MKTFKDLSEKLKKDKDDPCWKGYVQVGMKKKDGKEVPNCVPKEGVEEEKDTHKTKDGRTAKKGLWYNINQKKKRGEAPAKKGDPDYPKTLNIESIEEKAVSKAQQRFMGMVRAKQKGEMDDASPEVAKAAASMSKKDVKDFAKTKHKGLPAKKESVEEAFSPKEVKMAVGIASDPRYKKGNYTGAVEKIEKIKKGLSNHSQVAAVLKRQNENVNEAKVSVGDRVTLKPNKSVLDRSLIGKAGVITNMLDGEAMVKFANGRTIAVSPSHLTVNEESMNFFQFREALKEAKGSNYQIYHKTYSAAVQHAVNHVFDKMGYEVDSQDFFNKVSSGPRKPSPGKTNSFSIDLFDKRTAKPVRQKLHMQVYGMDSGKYELNMYVA